MVSTQSQVDSASTSCSIQSSLQSPISPTKCPHPPVCFFIYWLICIPPLTLSIRQWPILIKIKLVAYFLSCVGMLALALTASDGVGDTLTKRGSVQGSERVWLIVRFTLLATASCATFASNAADWQRNSTKPKDPILGQIFGFPMSNVSLII
jgi:NCS1 family nucleobase:cation symporter-1